MSGRPSPSVSTVARSTRCGDSLMSGLRLLSWPARWRPAYRTLSRPRTPPDHPRAAELCRAAGNFVAPPGYAVATPGYAVESPGYAVATPACAVAPPGSVRPDRPRYSVRPATER